MAEDGHRIFVFREMVFVVQRLQRIEDFFCRQPITDRGKQVSISKEESIVTQVAAKIAAEITTALNTGGNIEAALLDFDLAFGHVREALFKAHGDTMTAVFTEAFPNSVEVAHVPAMQPSAPQSQQYTQSPLVTAPTGLKVAGTQHGPLPDWILAATKRAGVTEIWDNRDKAIGTKRPWFKQAGTIAAGQEAVAFWAPRGVAA